jgi:hypothetical protein
MTEFDALENLSGIPYTRLNMIKVLPTNIKSDY